MGKRNKGLPKKSQPSRTKDIRSEKTKLPNTMEHHPVWQFKIMDFAHEEFGWKTLEKTKLPEVLKKLQEYETMTWAEIFKNKKRDHGVLIDNIIPTAQKRLKILTQEDIDSLFRLRLAGEERIWGILDRYIFKILWWDPEHKISPSTKKHT